MSFGRVPNWRYHIEKNHMMNTEYDFMIILRQISAYWFELLFLSVLMVLTKLFFFFNIFHNFCFNLNFAWYRIMMKRKNLILFSGVSQNRSSICKIKKNAIHLISIQFEYFIKVFQFFLLWIAEWIFTYKSATSSSKNKKHNKTNVSFFS